MVAAGEAPGLLAEAMRHVHGKRGHGTAEFDASGRFTVKSWEDRAGLVPGTYKVSVECWKVAPTIEGPNPLSHVPEAYQTPSGTPLEVVVDRGAGSLELALDVKSR